VGLVESVVAALAGTNRTPESVVFGKERHYRHRCARPAVLIISGPPGVGTSSVAPLATARFDPSACIESDWFWTAPRLAAHVYPGIRPSRPTSPSGSREKSSAGSVPTSLTWSTTACSISSRLP
jgi:hypothetical protein